MSKQPLRGYRESKLLSIRETLQLVLDTSDNEAQLRAGVKAVIANIKEVSGQPKSRSKL